MQHFLLGLAMGVAACLQPGPAEICEDQLDVVTCCDAATYATAEVPLLAVDPGRFAGQRVQTAGVADWYTEPDPGCVCGGGLCGCTVPLGLRGVRCPDTIHMSGMYNGRPVECSDAGCWPMQLLRRYAACGTWRFSAGGSQLESTGALDLDFVCEL